MSTSGVGAGRHAARSHTGGPSEPAGVTPAQEPRRRDRVIIGVIATASAVCLFSAGALVGQLSSAEAPAVAAVLPAASPSALPSSTPTAAPTPDPAQAPAPTVTVAATPSPTVTFSAPAAAVQRPADAGSPPVQVTIPDLGIDQGLLGLRVKPDRSLEIPESADDLGWWRDGPAPGEAGAALVVGHVDSTEGPGVFYHLSTLQEGAVVSVRRADGRTVRFAVTGTQVFPKDDFPDELVYRTEGKPSLHLVTCGGTFDRETGHYRDNVVVFADLIEETPAPETTPEPEPEPEPEETPAPENTPAGVTAEEKASADKVNAAIAEAIRRAAAAPPGADAPAQEGEDD